MQRQKRMRNTSDEEGARNETKKLFFRIIIAFCKFSVTESRMNYRIKSIEGCRGLAALMVMLAHFIVMFFPAIFWGPDYTHWKQGTDYLLAQILPIPAGDSAVTLFFVITGFGTYIAIDEARIDIRKYILLRYFKLLLLTLLGALPVVVLLKSGLVFVPDIANNIHTPWFNGWPPTGISLVQIILHNPLDMFVVYNNVLWTMPYFFYGTIISFILTSIYSRSLWANINVSLAAILILGNIAQYYYMACVMGVLLAFCYKYRPDKLQLSSLSKIIIFILTLYLCSYPTGIVGREGIFLQHDFKQAYIIYHTLGAALLAMLALVPNGIIKQVMESRLFQWLGRYSMGIYLIHYSILISLIAFLFSYLPEDLSYPHKTLMLLIIYLICSLAAGVPVQAAGNYCFRLLDKIYKNIFRRCFSE